MDTPTLHTVVLGTDGSADARLARRAVADIARATGTTVHVVGAWNLMTAATGAAAQSIPYDLPTEYEAETRKIVETDRRALEDAGVRAAGHVVCGRAFDAILQVAEREAAGLVVVGGRGRGAFGRLLLGSVSEAVVRHSVHPVLAIRGGAGGWPPREVVAGHDGSAESIAAVRLAALVAGTVGAALTVVEVMPRAEEGAAIGEQAGEPGLGEVLEGRRGELTEDLAGLLAWAPSGWQVRVEPGDPVRTLLDAAGGRPSLLAVGRRGIGRIHEALLGSVSTRLLHTAAGAVLVVPPPALTAV